MELLVSRRIDDLGRIALPCEIRKKLGWGECDVVSIYHVDNNTLMLQLQEKCKNEE